MEREKSIKFLSDPKSFSHSVKKVKHISTYISDVFLTGKFAYKIKKPVNYGYLDFTTLAKRKLYCYQELKLNRRLSREIYLKVLPIVEKDGRLKLGGRGKIVDYVLKMKEIPQKYIMYHQAKKKIIGKDTINQLAKIIAKFHAGARSSESISKYGSLKIINKNWQENFVQTKPFIGKTISWQDFNSIKKSVEEFIRKNKKLFLQRIKGKKIRDGHGDLHTGNIFVTPKKIFIFDCIEFNERFRHQDTASEVAFLIMDLDSLGRQDLADYFVKRYVCYSGDKINKELLLFYKCYRAYVKGKVCGFHFADRNLSQTKRKVYKKIAQRAFKLALHYTQEWQKPVLIIGAGLPGIGRSTRLKLLAQKIKAKILDSDVIRRQILKRARYDEKNKLLVYRKMTETAEEFLQRGRCVILDATFSKEKYRQLAKDLVKKLKIPYFLIEFYCSDKIAQERLSRRAKEKSISEADWQVYLKIKKEFEPIKKEENYFRINTVQTLGQCVKKFLKFFNHIGFL